MPTPTPPTDAQLLADAQAALHKLKIGALASEVEVDGRRVRFGRTDIDKLQGYVDDLCNRVNNRCPRRGAIGFIL